MENKQWLGLTLALALVGAAGCGPDIGAICEKQEDCLGGNESDLDACTAAAEGAAEMADDIGCADEFDAVLTCLEPKLECITGQACMADNDCNGQSTCSGGTCKAFGLDSGNQTACEAEQNAYSRCANVN